MIMLVTHFLLLLPKMLQVSCVESNFLIQENEFQQVSDKSKFQCGDFCILFFRSVNFVVSFKGKFR